MSYDVSKIVVASLLVVSASMLLLPFILVIGFLRQFKVKEEKSAERRIVMRLRLCGKHAREKMASGRQGLVLLTHPKHCSWCRGRAPDNNTPTNGGGGNTA